MPRVPIPNAFPEFDVFQIIMDVKRDGLIKKYECHSLEEAAAFNNVTLLYTEMEDSTSGMSTNSMGEYVIVLDPSLRKEDKIRMFFTWLAVVIVEREQKLDLDEEA